MGSAIPSKAFQMLQAMTSSPGKLSLRDISRIVVNGHGPARQKP